MAINCDLSAYFERSVFNTKRYKELNEQSQDELKNRVTRFVQDLTSFAPKTTDEGQSRLRAGLVDSYRKRFEFLMQVASVESISPTATKNLSYFLAYDMAIENTLLGAGSRLTEPGKVRHWLQRAARMGRGEVHSLLSNMQFLDRSKEADRVIRQIQREYRVDKDLMDIIKLEVYENGFAPYAEQALKANGPAALAFQRGRQARLVELMQQAGLDQQGMNRIVDAVQDVIDSYAEVHEVTQLFGVDVNNASELINYFPRNFSPETRRRIAWTKSPDNQSYLFFGPNSQVQESVYSMFNRSRNTDHYIPEDGAIVDWLLTNADPDIYKKMGVESSLDLIEDSGRFTQAFVEHLDKAHPTLFNNMVESGVISKLPMSGYEVFNYMQARYDLPFKSLREFTATDFETASRLYRNQLEQMVGRSLPSQFLAQAALEGNWGVTLAQKNADSVYRNYVPLVSKADEADVGAIPRSLAERFGLADEVNENLFIHPIARDMYQSAIDLGSNPDLMGILGKMVYDFNTMWRSQVLSGMDFVMRQIINIGVQTHAAGGNVLNYARNMNRIMYGVTRLAADGKTLDTLPELIFDNTKRRYPSVRHGGKLTELELWNMLREEGVIEEVMPWVGEAVQASNYRPRAGVLESMRRQGAYAANILAQRDLSLPQKVNNLYGQFSTSANIVNERVFYHFTLMNALLDQVAKFSTIQSLTTDSIVERGTRALQGNVRLRQATVESAITDASKYFYDYSDLGRLQSGLRTFIPFFSFQSKNTLAVFRMMVRHPSKFVAYNRLYAAMNQSAREQEDELPEAGVQDWLKQSNPVYWVNEETGQVIAFPTSSLDPVQDAGQTIFGAADALLGAFGIESGKRTTEEIINGAPWSSESTSRTLTNILDSGFPLIEQAYTEITGETISGYQLRGNNVEDTSFLGVTMSPMNRQRLETLLPILRDLNRSNPFYLWGRPPEISPEGEIVQPAIPSWAGGQRDMRDYVNDFRSTQSRLLATAGLSNYVVDVARNMGRNEEQVQFEIREGSKAIRKKEMQITEITDPARLERELHELEEMKFWHAALILDWENFRAWRMERNLPHPAAIRRVRDEGLRREQIRVLSAEEEYELLREVYGDVPELR